MIKRLISGLVGIAMFLGLCFWGALPYTIAVTILCAICASEFISAYNPEELARVEKEADSSTTVRAWLNPTLVWTGVIFPLCTYYYFLARAPVTGMSHTARLFILIAVSAIAMMCLMTIRAAFGGKTLGSLRKVYGLVGMAYTGILLSGFVMLRSLPGRVAVPPFGYADRGAWLMLFVAMCVWASDTFAYFVGRSCGRHKLSPILSPAKTVEGALGGLAGAILVGIFFGLWIHIPISRAIGVGVIAGVAGQIGDLFESALKRELGIKDFGSVMPGHGGALDRFDSLLFVAPFAYLFLNL